LLGSHPSLSGSPQKAFNRVTWSDKIPNYGGGRWEADIKSLEYPLARGGSEKS
jgi:hypothetical protein